MIRRVTEADIPWLHQLCQEAYPPGYYDPTASEVWVRGLLRQPTALLMRGERAWLNVQVNGLPWNPARREARFLPIASNGKATRELLEMTGLAIQWSKGQGASKMYFTAINGVDLGPLARRFGASPMAPSYVLDL